MVVIKKMNKFEQFKVFFDELTTNKIIFELKEVNCNELLNNYVYCVVKIKIIPYQLEFNYRFTLPFKFDKLTSKIKEDIINRIKIDINEFIVERIELNRIGDEQ